MAGRVGDTDEGTYQPRVMPEDLPRKIVPRMQGVSIAPGIEGVTDALSQKFQADSATYAGNELASFRTQAVGSLQSMKDSIGTGDPTDFTQNYLTQFDKQAQTLQAQSSANPYAQKMISKGVSDLRSSLYEHSLAWESAQRVAYRQDSVQQSLSTQLPIVEAHPELGVQVGSTLSDQIDTMGGDPSHRLALKREVLGKLAESEANGRARQDPQGIIQALNDPQGASSDIRGMLAGLSDQQREALRARASGQVSTQAANGVVDAYRTGGPMGGAQAFAAIDKLNQPDEVKEAIRQKAQEGVSQWRSEARQSAQGDIMGLEERLGAGKPQVDDRALTLSLFRRGAFTASEAGETAGRIDRALEAQSSDEANLKAFADAYRTGSPLDPKDKDVKEGVGALFSALTKDVAPGSAEWTNRAADIASRTGVAPEPVIAWARANLVSGDEGSAVAGAQAIERLERASPRGVGYALDEREKAQARVINDAIDAGTKPQAAVELARRLNDLPEATAKRLGESYAANQNAFAKSAPQALRSELSSFKPGFGLLHPLGGSLPAVPPGMDAQFSELQANYYKATGGNIAQARDLAAQDLKRSWGVTQVNGAPEFMQYAPEAMYPGLTAEFVRKDIAASLAPVGPYDPAKVRLTPTSDTATTQGRIWGLSVPDQFGAYDVLRGKDNRPIRYQIPDATDAVRAARDKLAADGLQKARALQTREKDMERAEWTAIESGGMGDAAPF